MTTLARPSQVPRDQRPVDELVKSPHGELIRPGDGGYDQQRRVWNGSIDRNPALIVRCADVADVRSAISFARAHDLLVAVRGGGHSFPGYSTCDGGIVIDLSLMKGIRVDPRLERLVCKPERFSVSSTMRRRRSDSQ
jgi:hypothetical protein